MNVSGEPVGDALPLISIALCTYNGSRYLGAQLESLLAQTYPNIEIVAVDDASSDDTVAILAEYASRDPRVRYLCNPRNLGFVGNFEVAMRNCRGSMIALCDQDDIWLPDKIRLLAEALSAPEVVLAYCNAEFMSEDGTNLGPRLRAGADAASFDDPAVLAFHSPCAGNCSLLRRQVVERALPLPEAIYHDWWLSFVAASIGRVAYVDHCLVRYRRHPGSITTRIDEGPRDRARGFRARELDASEGKLVLFAAYPGREQVLFRTLLELWRARKRQVLSLGLGMFMWQNRDRIFFLRAPAGWPRMRLAIDFFQGLRFKRLLEPHRYWT